MEKVSFREILFSLKMSRDLQMLFAAITHLVEGLRLESVHNRTTVNLVLENINKK
jgi:hypothetical protein